MSRVKIFVSSLALGIAFSLALSCVYAQEESSVKRIAVMEMQENENIFDESLTANLKNCLVRYLSAIPDYECLDVETNRKAAAGADYKLAMEFTGLGRKEYMFSFKLVEKESSRLICGNTVTGQSNMSDYSEICERLTDELATGLGIKTGRSKVIPEPKTEPKKHTEPIPDPVLTAEPTPTTSPQTQQQTSGGSLEDKAIFEEIRRHQAEEEAKAATATEKEAKAKGGKKKKASKKGNKE